MKREIEFLDVVDDGKGNYVYRYKKYFSGKMEIIEIVKTKPTNY